MPDFFRLEFGKGDKRCQLLLGWNEEALLAGHPQFDITASVGDGKLNASVKVEPDESGELMLHVVVGGYPCAPVPLRWLTEHFTFIDRVPAHAFGAGHPVLGCLVRAGLSAVLAQLIDCKNDTADGERGWPRLTAICRCIREHLPQLGMRAAFSAARCAMRFGF